MIEFHDIIPFIIIIFATNVVIDKIVIATKNVFVIFIHCSRKIVLFWNLMNKEQLIHAYDFRHELSLDAQLDLSLFFFSLLVLKLNCLLISAVPSALEL